MSWWIANGTRIVPFVEDSVPTEFSWNTIVVILLAAGVGTYLLRLSMIVLVGHVTAVPGWLSSSLRFVPPAVLATLVVAGLVRFAPSPTPAFVFEPAELIAGAIGAIVAWRTRNVLATIAVGMIVLWMTQLVIR